MVKKHSDQIFGFIIGLFAFLFALICLLPVIRIVSLSVSGENAVISGQVLLLPKDLTLNGLKYVLDQEGFTHTYIFTIWMTILFVVITMVMTIMFAYPLSKRNLRFRRPIIIAMVFTMMFNGGIIPNFIVIRSLGLLGSVWAYILPCAINAFHAILLINYFQSLPDSIMESAKIDGASNMTVLVRIVLPLSTPVLATLTLFYAVQRWNNWFDVLIYSQANRDLYTLQLYLRGIILALDPNIMNELQMDVVKPAIKQIEAAAVVLTILPILFVYPFLQKYFVSGITLGGVKE